MTTTPPPTPPRGRPTFTGQRMKQTALWLPADMLAWLKAQPGTMSETIRRLIAEAMKK